MTSIHVQYIQTESDRLGYATVRLTGSPIARVLEKYTEVYTECVEYRRINSIGYGPPRPLSLFVASTEQRPSRERLHREYEMFAELLHRTGRWPRTDG